MASTVKSSAKPISQEQLQAELSKHPAKLPEAPQEQQPEPSKAPDAEKQHVKTTPSVMDALNKSMADKATKKKDDEPANLDEEEKTPAKKEEPAKKKEPVSADDATPPVKGAEVTLSEEEKGVMPHDSARVRARIIYLNNEAKKAAAEAAQAKKELEEAKKAPPSAASAEEVAKKDAELQQLRDKAMRLERRYEWENNAETKAKYREPVTQAEKTIEEAFKRNNFAEPTLAAIREAGGFAAFSRSKVTYPAVVKNEDGEEVIVPTTAAELARSWLSRMPIADAQLINQSVGRQEDLKTQEVAARARAEDEAKVYFESQTAAQRQAQETAQATNKRLADEYETWAKKTEGETDWLKDAEVPADASEEDKKTLTERNAFSAELRAQIKDHPKTPQEYGALKFNAAKAKYLERELEAQKAEVEQLRAELKKKAAASRTTPKSGSLLRGDPKPTEEKAKPGDTDVMAAINRRMQAKASGDDE